MCGPVTSNEFSPPMVVLPSPSALCSSVICLGLEADRALPITMVACFWRRAQ
jgi:hypothetical protein